MVFGIGIPNPLDIGKGAAEAAANSVLSVIADGIGKAVEAATAGIGTAWIRIDTPRIANADGTATSVVSFMQTELAPYAAAIMVVSILLGAFRMAVELKGEPGRDVLIGLLTWIVITGAGAAVVGALIEISDAAAQSILGDAMQGDTFGKHLATMLALAGLGAPVAVMVIGALALLTCIVQIVLMIARVGLLVVMTSALPFVASAAATKTGRSWLERYLTWLLAFILYKPVAAVIYSVGFRLVDSGSFSGHGLVASLVGLTLLVSAVVALPALMRILAPATHAVATGDIGRRVAAAAPVPVSPVAHVVRGNAVRRGPTGAAPVGARRTIS